MCLFKRIYQLRDYAILGFLSLMIVFSFSGCSSIQIGYNQSDTLLRWWIDDHLDLNDSQAEFVSSALKSQLTWHRQNVMPKLGDDLQKLRRKLAKPLTKADVLESFQDIRKHSYMTVEHFSKDFSRLALMLQPEQLKVMEKKFQSSNEKYRKEFMSGSPQKQNDKRIERVIDRTENFFGSLSKEQEQQIAKIVLNHPVDMDAVFKERLRRQRELLQLLRKVVNEKPSSENVEQLFLNYVRNFEYGTNSENKETIQKRTDQFSEMIAQITELMDDKQRRHAQHKVGDWADDVKNLVTQR